MRTFHKFSNFTFRVDKTWENSNKRSLQQPGNLFVRNPQSSAKWSAGQVKVWNHWARMFFRNCALIWFYLETNSWCASCFKVAFKETCYWIWLTGNSRIFCIIWWKSRLLSQTFFRHMNGEYFTKLAWIILTISYFIKINITYRYFKMIFCCNAWLMHIHRSRPNRS